MRECLRGGSRGGRGGYALLVAVCLSLPACGSGEAPEGSPGGTAGQTGSAPAAPAETSPRVPALAGTQCPAQYEVAAERGWTVRETERALRRAVFEVDGIRTRLEPPVRWALNTGKSRAFRHQLHKMKWTDVLFAAYLEGDLEALRRAKALFVDWVRANPIGGEGTPAAAWADKRTGDRLSYLSFLLRAGVCEGVLDTREQRLLLRSARKHVGELLDPGKYKPTNHGLFQDLGLALAAEQLSALAGSSRWKHVARRRFKRTLLRRLHPGEGLWLEHSADYQVLITKLVERFTAIPGVATPGLGRVAERMREVSAWLVMPDGKLLQSGDSHRSAAPGYLDGVEEPDGLLALPRSGLAVVREGGSYLALQAGFHNSTHKHSDALSFDLFEGGTRVVADTGLFHKDFGEEYEFVASAAAHSGVVVDGQEPSRADSEAYGSGLLAAGSGAGWHAILATDPQPADRGVRLHRLLLYRPGQRLIVVDSLRAGEQHRYTRRFQLGERIEVARAGARLELAGPALTGTLALHGADGFPVRPRTIRGSRRPLAGLVAPSFRRWLPRTTVQRTDRAADTDLVADLALGGAPAPGLRAAAAGPHGGAVRLGSRVITVKRSGTGLEVRVRP